MGIPDLIGRMETFRFGFEAMGGGCEFVLASADRAKAQNIAHQAIEDISRIERKYSRYRKDSIVSLINAAAGAGSVACDEETLSLATYADVLYNNSDGLFDVTAGVLRRAWDFKRARVPDTDILYPLLELIDWKSVERTGHSMRLPKSGMEIDFGGIGKEYATDRAAAIAFNNGMRHGYVNLAGDIRIIGPKPDGEPWLIGIQDPRRKKGTIASIPMHTGALATSGDYERFFIAEGTRYCHIMNPKTGFPVSWWRSVSVVAPVAITAGSCSTIAMLKEADGLDFLEKSGFGYLAVDHDGKKFHQNR